MSTTLPAKQITLADQEWSARMADAAMKRYRPEDARWHYEHGLLLQAILHVGIAHNDPSYQSFVQGILDDFVLPDGSIRTYRIDEYNLDQINPGKLLLQFYQLTGDERYRAAATHLRRQLTSHPRTSSGGFWHKQIYPFQMWLDGLYMAGPFYAAYAQLVNEPAAFDDLAHQILLMEQHTRDPKSGLLFHAWDELHEQRWANPETGWSPHLWARAIGWFLMAIVDIMDYFPIHHLRRPAILARFARLCEAVLRVQDSKTGLWYQIIDQGGRAGNYLEASASAMITYAFAKGVRQSILPPIYLAAARNAHQGMLRELIIQDTDDMISLTNICAVAGLGGDPYRDGSYEYYISEPRANNDYKGVGPFILASLELERAAVDSLRK